MPTTITGLIIFVAFVTPGFLNYLQRRLLKPQSSRSPLVEIATFFSISFATNIATLGLFSLVRWVSPYHTLDLGALVTNGSVYIRPRIGYVTLWGLVLLITSCCMAVIVAKWPGPIGRLVTPLIVDTSAWYYLFEKAPVGALIYLGCDLEDGSYVGGYLYWYNTDPEDGVDRDIILSAPITIRNEQVTKTSTFEQVILSARNISKISVEYVSQNKNSN